MQSQSTILILAQIMVQAFHLVRGVVSSFLDDLSKDGLWVEGSQDDAKALAVAEALFLAANSYRISQGKALLIWNEKLANAATYHAKRMKATGEFDHVLSDGVDIGARVSRHGYQWQSVRENIAMFVNGAYPATDIAKQIHDGWVHSAGHEANLVAGDVTELGVGVIRTIFGEVYAVQNFATPTSFHSFVSSGAPAYIARSAKRQDGEGVALIRELTNGSKLW